MVLPRVICAISGGVDSAVATLLLKKRGLDVCGVFMRNWDLRDEVGHCSSDEDCDYANRVCQALDVPFHEVNLVKEYWTNVFEPTVIEYENGNTPNPDTLCNHHVKFDALHNKCLNIVGSKQFVIATGHYAQTSIGDTILQNVNFGRRDGDVRLLNSADPWKDQTFFLSQITQQALRRTFFPIGHLCKSKVKEIAENSPIDFTLKRKESMGICFIGKRNFADFIKDYLPPRPGRFVCYETGKVLGRHDGYYVFTVGQRSRLGGHAQSYVVLHKDVKTADVFVVPGVNHRSFYSRSMIVETPHWIRDVRDLFPNEDEFQCQFRFMHQAKLLGCTIHKLEENSYLAILDEPTRALTIGQTAVFYVGNECLGGARISDVGPSMDECLSHDRIEMAFFRSNPTKWLDLIDRFPELSYFKCDQIIGYNLFKSSVS